MNNPLYDNLFGVHLGNDAPFLYLLDGQIITYRNFLAKSGRIANTLVELGLEPGDRVAIQVEKSPEMLNIYAACAQAGLVFLPLNPSYTVNELKYFIENSEARLIICDEKNKENFTIISQKLGVLVETLNNDSTGSIIDKAASSPEYFETVARSKNDLAAMLYTSGTTGKPKGVIHTHGGFSVFAGHQASYLVDIHQNDTLFWRADIGWITGLVWNVYGLLIMGASAIIYDGALDYPTEDRIWQILSKHNATIFGISPTAVRLFKKNNAQPLKKYSLDKLRNIPTTGEPLDEDSWWWLFEKVGNKKIPIMNLSGGTEIGGAMLSVFPGMKLKPSTVGIPVPGMNLDIVDDDGNSVREKNGYLVIKSPWPAMTRGLLHDDDRYIKTYWSRFENIWFHGDYVFADSDNLWYMHGRTDDVINVSGHRMSTSEITMCSISDVLML
jgi:acetyl-CoA synthetase